MHRSLVPFILTSLGFFMFLIVIDMPLFEWDVSEIVTEVPATYNVHIFRSPWTTYLGDTLDDGSYVLRDGVGVTGDTGMCDRESLKFLVNRSWNDELLERILNVNLRGTSMLFTWGKIEIFITGIYIWWFIIGHKHGSVSQALLFTGIAMLICILLILSSRVVGPRLAYPEMAADCYGTISFKATLLKVHYETSLVLFLALSAEANAIIVMLRQLGKITEATKGDDLSEYRLS